MSEIRIRTGLRLEDLTDRPGVWTKAWVWSDAQFERWAGALISAIETHQTASPLEAGLPIEVARTALDLEPKAFDDLLEELVLRDQVVQDENLLRTPAHLPAVEGPQQKALLAELAASGPSPPLVSELRMRFDIALIRALVRSGALVQVNDDIIYTTEFFADLKSAVANYIEDRGPITVAEFRDLIGTSRKYAVPLMEYLDQIGFTRRTNDVRVLVSPRSR